MKYKILSVKADSWKKGDRIIVSIDDDYFLATVTAIRSGQIYLKFDDGDNGKVSVGSKRILGKGTKRIVKKSFTRKDAYKYLVDGNRDNIVEQGTLITNPQLLDSCKFFDKNDNEWKYGRIIKLNDKIATVLSWEHNTIWTYTPNKKSLYKSKEDGGISKQIARAYSKYYKAVDGLDTNNGKDNFSNELVINKAKIDLFNDLRKDSIKFPEIKPVTPKIGDCVRFVSSIMGAFDTTYFGRIVFLIPPSISDYCYRVLYKDGKKFKIEFVVSSQHIVLLEDGPKANRIKSAIPDKLVTAWNKYYKVFSKEQNSKKAQALEKEAKKLEEQYL